MTSPAGECPRQVTDLYDAKRREYYTRGPATLLGGGHGVGMGMT